MKKGSEAGFIDPILIIQNVAGVLESLDIRYFLTGSFASSLHGIPRATNDADLVVEMTEGDVSAVFDHFRAEFYISMDAMREAVIRQRSFNLIHLMTMFKIDIFVIQPESLPEMDRRQAIALSDGTDAEIFVAAPEDVIVRKLMWYKLGNEVAAQQWQDVLGILRVRCNELDYELLMKTARHHDVASFLEKAIDEAEK
ncbi:hypothetical protein JW823_00675 [bacterium]|nr:hypothetical protein [candidate division CSSED10-310 bacterium]